MSMEKQRTYALVGTGGCGKTSLAEMLLFQAGIINRLGAIEEGTTALDYEPEEIKRRGSIQPGFASFDWQDCHHNLIDIPGDANFSGDIDWLLSAADIKLSKLCSLSDVQLSGPLKFVPTESLLPFLTTVAVRGSLGSV